MNSKSNLQFILSTKTSINIRCTVEEHKLIKAKAAAHGMSTSEYVRFTALNATITVKTTN